MDDVNKNPIAALIWRKGGYSAELMGVRGKTFSPAEWGGGGELSKRFRRKYILACMCAWVQVGEVVQRKENKEGVQAHTMTTIDIGLAFCGRGGQW